MISNRKSKSNDYIKRRTEFAWVWRCEVRAFVASASSTCRSMHRSINIVTTDYLYIWPITKTRETRKYLSVAIDDKCAVRCQQRIRWCRSYCYCYCFFRIQNFNFSKTANDQHESIEAQSCSWISHRLRHWISMDALKRNRDIRNSRLKRT